MRKTLLAAALCALLVAGCGGGGGGSAAPATGSAVVSTGVVTGFGSVYVNGVAKSHAAVSQRMFPGYEMHAITNGVHPHTWTSEHFARLYDNALPGWRHEPEQLVRIDQVADQDEALELLVSLQVDLVLTSGGAPTAAQGEARLRRLGSGPPPSGR